MSANVLELLCTAATGLCCGLIGARFAYSYTQAQQSEPPSGIIIGILSICWSLLMFAKYGISFEWGGATVLGAMFITGSAIDSKTLLLPDLLTLPAAIVALPFSIFILNNDPTFAFYGALAGSVFFYLVAKGYKILRGCSGLGMGDVKLLISLGALTGPTGIFYAITVGSSCLLLWCFPQLLRKNNKLMQTALPYGPFLSFGTMTIFLLQ